MQTNAPQPAQPDELDSFRSEWINEVNQRHQPNVRSEGTETPPPQASNSSNPPLPKQDTTPPLVIYASAVYYERVGLLDEALIHYRKAFRLEPEIDHIYQNLKPDQIALLERNSSLENHSPSFSASSSIHIDEPSTLSNLLHRDLTSDRSLRNTVDYDHDPSSTNHLLLSLLASFHAHPWHRDLPHSEDIDQNLTIGASTSIDKEEEREITKINEKLDNLKINDQLEKTSKSTIVNHQTTIETLKFEPIEITEKSLFIDLPVELIVKMLSVYTKKRSLVHLSVNLIERFARVSRFARILTLLEKSIWRAICETIYTNDLFINNNNVNGNSSDIITNTGFDLQFKLDFVLSLCSKFHHLDWRKMFIDQPRPRLDGCYIALVRYPRLGESANPWYTPTHFVTYFRYLRFFENGTCISLTSTEEPTTIVRKLIWPTMTSTTSTNSNNNDSKSLNNLLFGLWSLENNSNIKISNLHQDFTRLSARTSYFNHHHNHHNFENSSNRNNYQFLMDCWLSSTRRGKMNKLEIKRLATINLNTGEILEVPLSDPNDQFSSSKPFIFSRVVSYDHHF